jgi:hypothetical protein
MEHMPRRTAIAALVALALTGCLPDLGRWQIVEGPASDGGVPGVDGGGPRTPVPIELGPPCPNPHLVVGTVTGTSNVGRVLRIDPSTNARCRDSALIESQRAYGDGVLDIDWHPDTGTVLGLMDAVLGLDGEGFPRWRHQETSFEGIQGEWVAAFGQGASTRIAVAWTERSSSIDSMVLLGADGIVRSGMIDPPFFGAAIAAHPDGSARLLIPTRARPLIEVYDVNDLTTRLPDTSTTHLWASGPDLPSMYGNRTHLASDVTTGRLVIAHERGIAFWQLGAPAPATAVACPSLCSRFHAAAIDPSRADGTYAICVGSGTSSRHLVHLRGSECSLVIDGTSLSGHTLQDVTLARMPI